MLTVDVLAKLIEHNNWANQAIIRACRSLGDDELDARPLGDDQWSIRIAVTHLVECQQGYLSLLTRPPEARSEVSLTLGELEESARSSGEGLLALARDAGRQEPPRLETTDGYRVEPWVVMVQVVNHGNDHRRQIASTLRALGLDPPRVDGWAFGEASDALTRVQE